MPVAGMTPKISNTACIFSITRLLQHFNDVNVKKFRQLLIKASECSNEAQLLCNILPSLSESMTNESLTILKNETMALAEQQSSKYDKTISLYKEMQQKYKDRLSNLHSDIIDYFGTFLCKKQSIELGYLNKQLYIETQKQSYLLKRLNINDPPVVLDDIRLDKLFHKQTNLFSYTLATQLHLNIKNSRQQQRLQHSSWYKNNAFFVLNSFTCQYNVDQCLATIPIKQFFCQNRNRNLNHFTRQARSKQIKKFECIGKTWNQKAITTFCNNFNDYFVHDCKNNMNNIRNIEQLTMRNTKNNKTIDDTSQLLLTLGQISKKIKMENCAVYIDDINQLKRIFHSNLRQLEYDLESSVYSIGIDYVHGISHVDVTDLEVSIIVKNAHNYSYMYQTRSFRSILKQLRLQGKVQCLKISLLKREFKENLQRIFVDVFNIATNATDTDNDNVSSKSINTGTNETIMIIVHQEEETLFTFAEILSLFHEMRLSMLNSAFNNIQKVIFQFCLEKVHDRQIKAGKWAGRMWKQKSDNEYPVDSNKIEHKNCDLEEKNLGVLYQNIIKWFQNMQQKYGNDKLKEEFYLHLTLNKI